MTQLTLSLFDTTALSGFTLNAPSNPRLDAQQRPEPVQSTQDRVPPHTYRLEGERALAKSWRARAADNLEAIRILQAIESEGRHARHDEQERLARFVGFGASDLANNLFRRAGEPFKPGWEDLGNELEQLATPSEMAALARSTQYAHYTPEFMVRAVWSALGRFGFKGLRGILCSLVR